MGALADFLVTVGGGEVGVFLLVGAGPVGDFGILFAELRFVGNASLPETGSVFMPFFAPRVEGSGFAGGLVGVLAIVIIFHV